MCINLHSTGSFALFFWITTFAVLASSSSVKAQPTSAQIDSLEAVTDESEYDVVSAVIRQEFLSGPPPYNERCLVLVRITGGNQLDTSESHFSLGGFRNLDSALKRETVLNYAVRNSSLARWDAKFSVDSPYRWHDYGHPASEKCFGKISFTRVGFDSTHTQAILRSATNCGSLCGEGRVYFLEKIEGKWRVKKTRTEWMI